jgi:hypothetical protein
MDKSKTVLILYLNLIHKEASEREAVKSSSNLLYEILSLGGWMRAWRRTIYKSLMQCQQSSMVGNLKGQCHEMDIFF